MNQISELLETKKAPLSQRNAEYQYAETITAALQALTSDDTSMEVYNRNCAIDNPGLFTFYKVFILKQKLIYQSYQQYLVFTMIVRSSYQSKNSKNPYHRVVHFLRGRRNIVGWRSICTAVLRSFSVVRTICAYIICDSVRILPT